MTAPHPLPDPGPVDAPFWAALAAGELRIQRCTHCERWQHPPRPQCAGCGRPDTSAWEVVDGPAELWSYTVCHPPVLPAFTDRVPYVAAVVRLAQGSFLVTRLVDPVPDPPVVGAPCVLAPTSIDGVVLPTFRVVADP